MFNALVLRFVNKAPGPGAIFTKLTYAFDTCFPDFLSSNTLNFIEQDKIYSLMPRLYYNSRHEIK